MNNSTSGRGGRRRLVALTALLLVACGSEATMVGGDGTSAPAPGAGATAPTDTTVAPPPLVPIAARPPCEPDPPTVQPERTAGAERPGGALSEIGAEQNRLRPVMAVAEAYQSAHPDEVAELAFDNNEPVSVVVWVTGDVEAHRAALMAASPEPDRIHARKACATRATLEPIRDAATAAAPDGIVTMASADPRRGVAVLALHSHGIPTADRLLAAFPGWLSLTVGGKPYPPGAPNPFGDDLPTRDRCAHDPYSGPMPEEAPIPGLDIELVMDETVFVAGGVPRGRLVLRNTGASLLHVSMGDPEHGVIVRRGTHEVVSWFSGDVTAKGWSADIEPGASAEHVVRIGTDPCAPDGPYQLPAGPYDAAVRVPVGRNLGPIEEDNSARYQWSSSVEVELTAS